MMDKRVQAGRLLMAFPRAKHGPRLSLAPVRPTPLSGCLVTLVALQRRPVLRLPARVRAEALVSSRDTETTTKIIENIGRPGAPGSPGEPSMEVAQVTPRSGLRCRLR
jgi:hypothetical protein